MNLAQQFDLLGRKQLAVQEGIQMLGGIQRELAQTRASADAWGLTAVLANATLIPLNVIVNAFELKTANTAYQILVRQLYGKFGQSGTRLDGHAKTALAVLRQAIVGELKRKALADQVPGVNILIGLAEDSIAAWQTAQRVQSGQQEMTALAVNLERTVLAAQRQLQRMGIERAQLLSRLQLHARTA